MNRDTERIPCVRGCTWEPTMPGEEPRPKEAKHNGYCNSCFYRLYHAIDEIPDLIAHMRRRIQPLKAATYETERVHGGKDSTPAPVNVDAIDLSDSLFARMVLWTEVISDKLKVRQPSVAVWMNFREIAGFRVVTPETAHELASQLASWFTVRLDDIFGLDILDDFERDICWGFDRESPGVFNLNGRYGVNPRQPKKHECPVCGAREVFVKWPDKLDPDIAVLCGRCKWVAEPEKYEFYIRYYADPKTVATSTRVARHLAQKYAGT